jgi:hypothetical protein
MGGLIYFCFFSIIMIIGLNETIKDIKKIKK